MKNNKQELWFVGTTSFVGRCIVEKLAEKYHVFAIASHQGVKPDPEPLKNENIQLIELDLLSQDLSDSFYNELLTPQIAFYFSNFGLYDPIKRTIELAYLSQYVNLILKKSGKRIVYVVRKVDVYYIKPMVEMFKDSGIQYTIIIKDWIWEKGTFLYESLRNIAARRYRLSWKAVEEKEVYPIPMEGFLNSVLLIVNQDEFINKVVQVQGDIKCTIRRLIDSVSKTTNILRVPFPFVVSSIHNWALKKYYKIPDEDFHLIKVSFLKNKFKLFHDYYIKRELVEVPYSQYVSFPLKK